MNSTFDDKEYWNKYYSDLIEQQENIGPSPFAQYLITNQIIIPGDLLVELGCGIGRDSKYFAHFKTNVIAVDQCENATSRLNLLENIESYAADFTNMKSLKDKANIIYSRFTMHSINAKDEDNTINWAYDNLTDGGCFCIEVRTVKDPIFGKGIDKGGNVWFHNNHHRRFVVASEFKQKLEKVGFKIDLFDENNGYAIYKNQDPIVLRAIVRK